MPLLYVVDLARASPLAESHVLIKGMLEALNWAY